MIIVDGTTDIDVKEQESMVVRYVDEEIVPHDVFLGLFAQTNGTTGEALSVMLLDCFLQLGLPLENFREQTYWSKQHER